MREGRQVRKRLLLKPLLLKPLLLNLSLRRNQPRTGRPLISQRGRQQERHPRPPLRQQMKRMTLRSLTTHPPRVRRTHQLKLRPPRVRPPLPILRPLLIQRLPLLRRLPVVDLAREESEEQSVMRWVAWWATQLADW